MKVATTTKKVGRQLSSVIVVPFIWRIWNFATAERDTSSSERESTVYPSKSPSYVLWTTTATTTASHSSCLCSWSCHVIPTADANHSSHTAAEASRSFVRSFVRLPILCHRRHSTSNAAAALFVLALTLLIVVLRDARVLDSIIPFHIIPFFPSGTQTLRIVLFVYFTHPPVVSNTFEKGAATAAFTTDIQVQASSVQSVVPYHSFHYHPLFTCTCNNNNNNNKQSVTFVVLVGCCIYPLSSIVVPSPNNKKSRDVGRRRRRRRWIACMRVVDLTTVAGPDCPVSI